MKHSPNVLVVDDDPQMLAAMEAVLRQGDTRVTKCSNGREALTLLDQSRFDIVISDLQMPVMSGEELLSIMQQRFPEVPVVMVTAYGTINQAVSAMKLGAIDFITKPFSPEDLEQVVARICKQEERNREERAKENAKPTERRDGEKKEPEKIVAFISQSKAIITLIELVTTVAKSSATILIQGESGTGKEVIAQLIHNSSNRAKGPFVAVNCAALPANLLESELFGYEKGAFTGAIASKPGKFELAQGGTILLDEVSEMEPLLQAKLLRVLQEREVDRVGGVKPTPIDVRVVATTNRNMQQLVASGKFRDDLYFRLNVIPLSVPPLRERQGDIPLLVRHFIARFSGEREFKISDELVAELERYPWPGNVRELQHACERAVLLAGEGELKAEHFFLGSPSISENDQLRLKSGMSVAEAEKRLILETLKATAGNRTKAAELLSISVRTLRNKLHEYRDAGVEIDGKDDEEIEN